MADLLEGLPGLKPPYPSCAIGAPLNPSIKISAINHKEGGVGVVEAWNVAASW